MVAPVHARLRIGGTLYGDALWSTQVNLATSVGTDPFSGGTLDTPASLQNWIDNVRQLNGGNILPVGLRQQLSTQGTIEYLRGSRIGPDGRESDVALIDLDPKVVGLIDPKHQAQTALVMSLLTGRPGGSYRGRSYLPAIGTGLNGLGRVPSDQAPAIALAYAQWIALVADASEKFGSPVAITIRPVVVSNTRSVVTTITNVRVGDRLDSQRRRAEGEKEVYSVAAVPQ